MVAGLAFLSKKGFNPANRSNQKAVWEAQQEKQHQVKKAKEREDQLQREREDEELARARGGDRGGNQASLKFMYDAPPGLAATGKSEQQEGEASANSTTHAQDSLTTDRQPGDDDAAAAFRQMLAAEAAAEEEQDDVDLKTQAVGLPTDISSSGAALSGTTIEKSFKDSSLTALEKAVGRRDANSSLTLEEQVQRFPQLKNAPMAKGMNETNVNVTFKPLGTQLRNVRCMACGVWGHSRGDRECSVTGWNPFSSTSNTAITAAAVPRQQDNHKEPADDGVHEARVRKRERDDDSSSSSSEESRRRRKRHRKHKKSRRYRHESKRRRSEDNRRRRSSSSDDERRRHRKSSHKKHKKRSSRHGL